MACLSFLTTIWGEGIVFTWFLNLVGISSLLLWASIGVISIRFRYAWNAQGRSLSDLPYIQPLFPLLPVTTLILAVLMFVGEGYAAVVVKPFNWRVCPSFSLSLSLFVFVLFYNSLRHTHVSFFLCVIEHYRNLHRNHILHLSLPRLHPLRKMASQTPIPFRSSHASRFKNRCSLEER